MMPASLLRPHWVGAVLAFAVGASLGACNDGRPLCARVVCEGGRVCDPTTGGCVDSAAKQDGGSNPTADAGSVDAGHGCDPVCGAGLHCDLSTSTCVECLVDSQCHCPASTCDANHSCQVPAADAGFSVPAPGESCGSAALLHTCNTSISFTIDLTTMRDDEHGSCVPATNGGHDAVYSLVLDATVDVKVTARRVAGTGSQPVVALRRGCTGAELACKNSVAGVAQVLVRSLPADTYGLIIDSFDGPSAGPVTVTVELLPATQPANESCPTAVDIPTTGENVQTDLTNANDDLELSCNPNFGSPDVVYRFTLAAPADVNIVAVQTPPVTGTDTVVGLLQPCGTANELRCSNVATGGTERLKVRALPAGTYFVVVENAGSTGAAPTFVRVTATTPPVPPPANDTCGAPRAITFSGAGTFADTFDTSLTNDDAEGTCNPEAASPEEVFSFTLGAPHTVTVHAVPSSRSAADPVVYLRSADCDGGVEEACDSAAGSGDATFQKALSPGTYYLFLEGRGLDHSGPTDLSITLGP